MITLISKSSFILEGWFCCIVEIAISYKSQTFRKTGPIVKLTFDVSALIGLNASQ